MPANLIVSNPDSFHGEIIDPAALTADPRVFADQLDGSIAVWRDKGAKVVWLELDTAKASLVPIAVNAGFVFHHADPDGLVMTLRLSEAAYIPPYATHYVGAGGVVLRDPETLLVVCERFRRGRPPYYKLPGGALHQGEHIKNAVVREVKEETGIDARFISLACFRHWHGYRYGKSDIYFVCRLEAITFEIKQQQEEIEECFWMPVEKYLNHPDVAAFNRRIVRAVLEGSGLMHDPIEGYGTPETHELFMPR